MRWRPRRSLCRPGSRCEAWQDGRHLRAAQRGPRLMEGQYERVSQSRELLYSVPAATVRGDCARGHGGACGAAEHSGLGFLQWKKPIFNPVSGWKAWVYRLHSTRSVFDHAGPFGSSMIQTG